MATYRPGIEQSQHVKSDSHNYNKWYYISHCYVHYCALLNIHIIKEA